MATSARARTYTIMTHTHTCTLGAYPSRFISNILPGNRDSSSPELLPLLSLSSSWLPQRHPSHLTQPACSSSATHVELLRRRHTPDVPATYAVDAVALERLTPPRHRAYQRTTAPTRSSFPGGRATAAAAYAAVQRRHAVAPSRTPNTMQDFRSLLAAPRQTHHGSTRL